MDRFVKKLSEYIASKGISNYRAEKDLGLGNGSLAKIFERGTGLKADVLEKIEMVYPDFVKNETKPTLPMIEKAMDALSKAVDALSEDNKHLRNENAYANELIRDYLKQNNFKAKSA